MLDRLRRKLEEIERRCAELDGMMSDPEVLSDPRKLQQISKARAELQPIVETYERLKGVMKDLEDAEEMLKEEEDGEMIEFLKGEIKRLKREREKLEEKLKLLLIPKDPNDERNVIMEIRAGAGGEEAALFAADLFRMYARYAKRRGWKVEVLSSHPTELGGFKEIIFRIEGKGAYSRLKYERGVHRVQRVPLTESGGRIHTSTATVAVLPKADEVDIQINSDDLRIDTFRSQGAGGQHVNKVDSAVRVTHLPTGIVVSCQDERSQTKNKMKALTVLRARLLDQERQRQFQEETKARRAQVGTGERSEKIRTYNFPQGRVSDHRINLTIHNIDAILEGALDELIDALATDQAKLLEEKVG